MKLVWKFHFFGEYYTYIFLQTFPIVLGNQHGAIMNYHARGQTGPLSSTINESLKMFKENDRGLIVFVEIRFASKFAVFTLLNFSDVKTGRTNSQTTSWSEFVHLFVRL